jgi:hypothetical protein
MHRDRRLRGHLLGLTATLFLARRFRTLLRGRIGLAKVNTTKTITLSHKLTGFTLTGQTSTHLFLRLLLDLTRLLSLRFGRRNLSLRGRNPVMIEKVATPKFTTIQIVILSHSVQ